MNKKGKKKKGEGLTPLVCLYTSPGGASLKIALLPQKAVLRVVGADTTRVVICAAET